jgi:Lysylphosphatidylglycerol synthase TM region
MAGRAGVGVPEVLAAGRFGPSRDAALDHRDLLPRLREAVASGAGIEVPKLAEVKRVSWPNLLFAVGSLIGIWLIIGVVPVPGGLGVVEAGLIAGLAAAGIPQDQAVAAVLIQRFFAAYLPPVWGWFTLAWMRRREYV